MESKDGKRMEQSKDSRQLARETMMGTEPVPRLILKMAYPTIVGFLINSIYSLADIYFVSSLGTNATAAVSVNNSLDQFIMMMGSMFAIGANSYIARLLGAGKRDKASRVLSTSFLLAMFMGALFLVFGVMFRRPLVRLLGATDTCEKYAIDYATYILYAAPFMAANFVMNQCLRSEGSALFSMFGMGFGGILNCFLDPVFILPWGLDMGVAGASLATAISKLVSFAILISPYLRHKSMLRLSPRLFTPDLRMIGEVLSIGSSSLLRNACAILSGILINKEAGLISDALLASIGVTTKVMMFPFSIILGFCSGFQPVTGFNWGAKKYDRVRESIRFSSRVGILGSLVMGLLIAVFARPIIGLFAGSDEALQHYGALCIRLQCLVLVPHGWVAVVNFACAGLGRAKGALLLSTSRQGTCFLPVLYPLSRLFGAVGVCSVQAVADLLSLAIAVPIFRKIHCSIDETEAAELAGKAEN